MMLEKYDEFTSKKKQIDKPIYCRCVRIHVTFVFSTSNLALAGNDLNTSSYE